MVPADQGSRTRYRAFQVFCWDYKSVPFPISRSWWKPVIMVLNHALFIRNHYPPPPHTSPMSKSGPDVFLIFQCSGTCPTPAQGDFLYRIESCFSPTIHNKSFTQAEIRAIPELEVRLVEAFQYMYFFC